MELIRKFGKAIKKAASIGGGECFVSAVILAAGIGSRMKSDCTKQWIELGGMPIVVRTLLTFQRTACINEIIICARKEELSLYDEIATRYGITKLTKIVEGGQTRQTSALEGFKAISDDAELVAIHDAARCLVTEDMITSVVNAARKHGAACAARPTTDTVKRVDKNGFITETLNRTEIWLAQTPQVFGVDAYRASAYTAIKDGFCVTDDASLLEHCNFKVKAVDCGVENIKITQKADIAIAEAILENRRK